jgi:uncharacterized protein YbjT (DUF2867 family)
MKVILFGATGMVGQGVLTECLEHADVETVLCVGRQPCGVTHPKLKEIVQADLYDYAGIENQLTGYGACFFCLGVSSAGMKEEAYHHVTYDLTLAAANALVRLNREMTFCYVSGAGTDSSEKGRSMWARVKGKTENALIALGFKATYLFRPGFIQPMKGVRSRTAMYRAVYAVMGPFFPVWKTLLPAYLTTSVNVGLAMIHVAQSGYSKPFLENRDINQMAA